MSLEVPTPLHIVGLSGGKDSTAMALLLSLFFPNPAYRYICTPTGNELPEMTAHWAKLERLLHSPLQYIHSGQNLLDLIEQMQMLPNFRARWCTRILKIEPTIEFMQTLPPGSTLYVGLRADEEERRGIFGEELQVRFPLREWGFTERHVWQTLSAFNVKIPARTDCAFCFGQRLGEWYALWKKYPQVFDHGAALETRLGHTFRSPKRDTWPASMHGLKEKFESGLVPRGAAAALREEGVCRVCRL